MLLKKNTLTTTKSTKVTIDTKESTKVTIEINTANRTDSSKETTITLEETQAAAALSVLCDSTNEFDG